MGLQSWELGPKAGPLPDFAEDAHAAIHFARQLFHQRQSQTGAFLAFLMLALNLGKESEKAALVRLGYAAATVGHRDAHMLIHLAQGHGDVTALGCKFQSVGQEVEKNFLERIDVTQDLDRTMDGASPIEAEIDGFLPTDFTEILPRLLDKMPNINALQMQVTVRHGEFLKIQQLIDEAIESLPVTKSLIQILNHVLVLFSGFETAQNKRQGCAEFMRDIAEKTRLLLIQLLQLLMER